MNSIWTFLLMFAGAVIIIAALCYFISHQFSSAGKSDCAADFRTQKDEDGKTIFVRCPICNSPLAKNDNLVSKIFHPMNVPDQLMYVLGCPHCYPVPEPGIKRECPVCHKTIPLNGYLVARLFNRTDKKKHVLVTGCSECYKH